MGSPGARRALRPKYDTTARRRCRGLVAGARPAPQAALRRRQGRRVSPGGLRRRPGAPSTPPAVGCGRALRRHLRRGCQTEPALGGESPARARPPRPAGAAGGGGRGVARLANGTGRSMGVRIVLPGGGGGESGRTAPAPPPPARYAGFPGGGRVGNRSSMAAAIAMSWR